MIRYITLQIQKLTVEFAHSDCFERNNWVVFDRIELDSCLAPQRQLARHARLVDEGEFPLDELIVLN